MKLSIKLMSIMSALALLAGCSSFDSLSPTTKNLLCAVTGAAVGGGAGAAIDDSQTAAGGAVAGAMLGLIVCPQEKAPVDTDGDGVTDDKDQCPNTPAGASVDSVGCSDSDGDGITDNLDKCPGTPAGTKVDATGCPVENTTLLSLPNVQFGFDKANLTDEAKTTLDSAVSLLESMKSSVEVRVEGNTDSIGSAAYNMKLSQDRAQSVVDYLVSKGISANLLTPVGLGETNPVQPNDTAEGRAANRRVDFVVK